MFLYLAVRVDSLVGNKNSLYAHPLTHIAVLHVPVITCGLSIKKTFLSVVSCAVSHVVSDKKARESEQGATSL